MSEGYYGRNGALGLATPQANPTAETEFRALMPQGVACATVRMVSAEPDPATRLRAYFTGSDTGWVRYSLAAGDWTGLHRVDLSSRS